MEKTKAMDNGVLKDPGIGWMDVLNCVQNNKK